MNFKQSIYFIYFVGFYLQTFYFKNVIAFQNTDGPVSNIKENKQYIRNENIKKHRDNTKSVNITDADLEDILREESTDHSTQNLSERNGNNDRLSSDKVGTVLDHNVNDNTPLKNVEHNNSDNEKITENKDKEMKSSITNQESRTSDEKENSSNTADSNNLLKKVDENKNEQELIHNNDRKSNVSLNNNKQTDEEDDSNIDLFTEDIIDQLANLLVETFDNKSNNNGKDEKNFKHLSDVFNKTPSISSEEDSEEVIDDIEPKIEKTIYYPLGKKIVEQFIKALKKPNQNSEEQISSIPLQDKDNIKESEVDENEKESKHYVLGKSLDDEPQSLSLVSFLQNNHHKRNKLSLNEDNNSDDDNNNDDSENDDNNDSDDDDNDSDNDDNNSDNDDNDSDNDDINSKEEELLKSENENENENKEEEEVTHNLEEEKIKEDKKLASYDMEEDTDEININNRDDPSIQTEKKLIRNARKVYTLNLFNCDLINDWDFTKEYIDLQGALVKLSGYVFQNILNSNTMPTVNITEWKLKGSCDYNKYICGALKYLENIYEKGDRVIFDGKIYEALNDTVKSPKDQDGTWVDKTNECFDS